MGETKIVFLHHSTGAVIWNGNGSSPRKAELPMLFSQYNKDNNTNYLIEEVTFPKATPYGWNNYPFDYYNIWVKNGGQTPFMEEPTLEILTKDAAIMYSLLGSCAALDVNPREWLTDVLTRIPYYNSDYSLDLADLLPDNWKAARELQNTPLEIQ